MVFVNRSLCLSSVLILLISFPSRCLSEMTGKIIGGEYGRIRQFPHAVFLDVSAGPRREGWMCGASILNQKLILTAAHCLEHVNLRAKRHNVGVYAGSEDYSTENAVFRYCRQLIIHEGYNENLLINDIGMGMLSFDLPFSDNIKRVILLNRFPRETNGIVTGWGMTNEEKETSDSKMKFLHQQMQPRTVCSKLSGVRQPAMFCASNTRTHKQYPSLGDSGSGFVTPKGEILGVVSYRDNDWKHILIYTNVTYHLDWIKTQSRRMACGF